MGQFKKLLSCGKIILLSAWYAVPHKGTSRFVVTGRVFQTLKDVGLLELAIIYCVMESLNYF